MCVRAIMSVIESSSNCLMYWIHVAVSVSMEHHSKSTDRIFHQHGAPALLLSQPICCTILIAIRCIQTSQSIMTAFQMFTFRKLIWIWFESIILSVFIFLAGSPGYVFALFYLLILKSMKLSIDCQQFSLPDGSWSLAGRNFQTFDDPIPCATSF